MDKGPFQSLSGSTVIRRSVVRPAVPSSAVVRRRYAESPPAIALRISSLRKRYGSTNAIAGVSFDLHAAERLVLLGPNGAGKTTLIRCVVGRTKPDSGSIDLLGKRLPPSGGRGAIGWVPQEIAVYNDLTAAENLAAFGRFHGLRGKSLSQRVDWALNWTGLSDRRDELVRNFSGGMQRRINLACGVIHSPRVLLLDEPTVGVDPQSRQRIFEMLDELRDGGASVLLTTHHLDEAQQRCDRIVIMDHGLVIAAGTLEQLVRLTTGTARNVRLQIDRPLQQPLGPWQHAIAPASLAHHQPWVQTRVDNVAEELPQLLASVSGAGYGVINVEVHAPTLHDVFLHLTGRELRD
jgi:ABC-2 type transport system ATP-binding protein